MWNENPQATVTANAPTFQFRARSTSHLPDGTSLTKGGITQKLAILAILT